MKLTHENFTSKGGRVFEISPKNQSKHFHAGRIFHIGIHDPKSVTVVTLVRFKFGGLKSDIFFHNRSTTK